MRVTFFYRIIISKKMPSQKACLTLLLVCTTLGQILQLDIQHPIQLAGVNKIIKQVLIDSSQNYLVHYTDESISIFSSSFQLLKTSTFPEAVEKLQLFVSSPPPMPLSNGTTINYASVQILSAFSNSLNAIRYYKAVDLTLLAYFNANQPILFHRPFVFIETNQSFVFVAGAFICKNDIKMGQNGILTTLFSYSQYINGISAASAQSKNYMTANQPDCVHMQQTYGLSMSDSSICSIDISLHLDYIGSSFVLDPIVGSFNYQFGLPEPINKYFIIQSAVKIIIMQTSNFHSYFILSNQISIGYISPTLSNREILQLISLYGSYFLLFKDSITQIIYNAANYSVTEGYSIPLSQSIYQIVAATTLTFLTNQNNTYITKIYPSNCSSSNTVYNSVNGTCTSYICSDPNCLTCSWNASQCNFCNQGFSLNASYGCIAIAIQPIQFDRQQLTFLQKLLQFLIETLKAIISIPGGRSLATPLFYYFTNFDSLYFYRFHDRNYGPTIRWVLDNITAIQEAKWNIIDLNELVQKVDNDSAQIETRLDFQNSYAIYQYQTPNHEAKDDYGLFSNNTSFFFINVPCLLTVFILIQIVFTTLKKHPLSRILRPYSLLGTLLIVCFDGNIQQFAYYLTEDIMRTFFFNFTQKIIRIFITIFAFLLFIVSCSGMYLCYIKYRKLNIYLCDNVRNCFKGISIQTIHFSGYGFLMGISHSILRFSTYKCQAGIILLLEVLYSIFCIYSIVFYINRMKAKVWIDVGLNFLRIGILFTLLLDYNLIGNQVIEDIQELIIYLMIGLFFLGISFESVYLLHDAYECLRKIYQYSKKKQKLPKKSKYRNENDCDESINNNKTRYQQKFRQYHNSSAKSTMHKRNNLKKVKKTKKINTMMMIYSKSPEIAPTQLIIEYS